MSLHQAASFLSVSSVWLIDTLEREGVPYRMVGSHRWIGLDVLRTLRARLTVGEFSYRKVDPAMRRQTLRDMVELGEQEDF